MKLHQLIKMKEANKKLIKMYSPELKRTSQPHGYKFLAIVWSEKYFCYQIFIRYAYFISFYGDNI